MTEQHALVQAELRVRVIELVRDVDPAVLDRPAAATPGWRVSTRTRAGASAIRFVTEHRDDIAGAGEPQVTVHAPRFELLRATTGRRSAEEIAGYEWEPAPDVTLLIAAPFFTMRSDSLHE